MVSARCPRCGELFELTTDAVLARCTELAQADKDDVLHYSDAEVREGWPGDEQDALDWLHRRSAGEADQ